MYRRSPFFVPLAVALVFGFSMGLYAQSTPEAGSSGGEKKDVLIIQDERPQVRVLEKFFSKNNVMVKVVEQSGTPGSIQPYETVVLFIHGKLQRTTELDVIEYVKRGGRLIVLHHSISSGKANNEHYFDFLGIQLDNPGQSGQPVKPGGGYGWYNGGEENQVAISIVNLDPNHYITSHQITWPKQVKYSSSDRPSVSRRYPGVVLENSEAYMNHKFTDGRRKDVLCGIKFRDPRNDQLFMQDRAAWIKQQGDGEIVYILPGDNRSDYRNPVMRQMILNAVTWSR